MYTHNNTVVIILLQRSPSSTYTVQGLNKISNNRRQSNAKQDGF